MCKVHKELFKLGNEKTSTLLKTRTEELSRRHSREDLRGRASPREAAPTRVTREVQSEATGETPPMTARTVAASYGAARALTTRSLVPTRRSWHLCAHETHTWRFQICSKLSDLEADQTPFSRRQIKGPQSSQTTGRSSVTTGNKRSSHKDTWRGLRAGQREGGASLRRLHAAWLQPCDTLEKAQLRSQ